MIRAIKLNQLILAFKLLIRRGFATEMMWKVQRLLEFSVVMLLVAGIATDVDFSRDIYRYNNGK